MNAPQRAIDSYDKEQRRNDILDAAERLFVAAPGRVASVDEVAQAAGLAKGTVYLYFSAKEDLYLALHERYKDRMFTAMIERAADPRPMSLEDMIGIARRYMLEPPAFLPLASLSLGGFTRSLSEEAACSFGRRLSDQMRRAGRGIERQFRLPADEGVRILHASYGLMVGLWQMSQCAEHIGESPEAGALAPLRGGINDAIEQALRDLWNGRLQRLSAARRARGKASATRRSHRHV